MLVRLVESPRFADFADSDEGHAAVYALGDALARRAPTSRRAAT